MKYFVILLLVLSFLPAQARNFGKISSKYSVLELKDCTKLKTFENNMGGSFRCHGLGKKKVFVAEDDLRFFVGFGTTVKKRQNISQTLPEFNTIFRDQRDRATIEWRGRKQGKSWKPFATILRYYTDGDGHKGQTLVVTKISGQKSCHIAYINARRPNANKLARRVADREATRFNCSREPLKY